MVKNAFGRLGGHCRYVRTRNYFDIVLLPGITTACCCVWTEQGEIST